MTIKERHKVCARNSVRDTRQIKLPSMNRASNRLNVNLQKVASSEKGPHAFVLRLWFEQTASSGHGGEWRGRITDVVSFEQRYFRGLSGLTRFLADHTRMLEEEEEADEAEPSQ